MIFRIYLLFTFYFLLSTLSHAQSIPYGDSQDSITTSDGRSWPLYYYKPAAYDSLNSPILWGWHGIGGNGAGTRNSLREMADNRNALVLAPTGLSGGGITAIDTINIDSLKIYWVPPIFKEIYRHVINRENRDSIWVYMIGFSNGGQNVTRYMLLRQAFPDSIPIRMAVSGNPLYYTFCTDTFNGVCMPYACGIGTDWDGEWGDYYDGFICNEHAILYYNDNYGVLIGTNDVSPNGGFQGGCQCVSAQGNNRYERAQNFYAFSDSDAVNRGTTLKWQYAEVPGVGHDGWATYHTKADTADTASIAETLLFDSPYYPPLYLPPTADFTVEVSDITCNEIFSKALCANNKKPTSVYWDFGDGFNSTEFSPVHTYSDTGTYVVTLIISNSLGSDTSTQNVTIDKLPPSADFTTDTTIVYLPNATVQFYNNSTDADYYYWDFGDSSIISTEVNPVHTYLWEDTFTVTLIAVNGDNGCVNTITKQDYIIVKMPSGVNEYDVERLSISIYPNPFSTSATVRINPVLLKNAKDISFAVYDLLGREVKKIKDIDKEQTTITRDNLPSGLYIYKIYSKKRIIYTGKLSIQ